MVQHCWQNHSIMPNQGSCNLIKTCGYRGLVGKYLWIFMEFYQKIAVLDCFDSQEMFVAMFRVALRKKYPWALSDLILWKWQGVSQDTETQLTKAVKSPGRSVVVVLAEDSKHPPEQSLTETGGTTPDMQARCKPSVPEGDQAQQHFNPLGLCTREQSQACLIFLYKQCWIVSAPLLSDKMVVLRLAWICFKNIT